MIYLTQIFIGKSHAARMRLSDAYAWHKRLWDAFPGRNSEKRDFLYRIDNRDDTFRILVLSKVVPTLQNWGSWECKQIRNEYLSCRFYSFQLKANPTMRRASDRRRLGLFSENMLRDWMDRKALENGFSILENTLVIGAPINETFNKNGYSGILVSVDFRGVLEVIEPEKFKRCFFNGIGSAKAFGFGLLSIIPFIKQ